MRSGVSQENGHVWIFEGSSTFFIEGRPTARHLDRCWMNCRVEGDGEPVSNGTLGRLYTLPLAPPKAAQSEAEPEAEDTPEDERPWYERSWDEAYRVGEETVGGWIESGKTLWDALPGTADEAATAAARGRIVQGATDIATGVSTLVGPPTGMEIYGQVTGDPQVIQWVDDANAAQDAAFAGISDAVRSSWEEAYARNGTAGAISMVFATLGMEAVGGKGLGALGRVAGKIADIVRLADTPMDAVRLLDAEISAAKAAGASADELKLLEAARAERLRQARRDANRDGVTINQRRLLPNHTYELNGYRYTTDEHGRIKTVEGELRKGDGVRDNHAQRTVGVDDGRLPDDQGGHVIGAQFDGYGGYENLTPMARDINQQGGEWARMEQNWARQIDAGTSVHVRIDLVYTDSTIRASSFNITETIGGQINDHVIINPI